MVDIAVAIIKVIPEGSEKKDIDNAKAPPINDNNSAMAGSAICLFSTKNSDKPHDKRVNTKKPRLAFILFNTHNEEKRSNEHAITIKISLKPPISLKFSSSTEGEFFDDDNKFRNSSTDVVVKTPFSTAKFKSSSVYILILDGA